MSFRIVVRSVEAWLLADRAKFADVFGVNTAAIPVQVENISNPKSAVLSILHGSRSRDIRLAMVRARSGSVHIGPEYNVRLASFAENDWRPQQAALTANSLSRAIASITVLATRLSKKTTLV
jgi:hypothetical protein